MAMEKLLLRGVMWGADKVPDHWFDKVPGGFYTKAEEEAAEHDAKERKKNGDMPKHTSDRRNSEADFDSKRSRRRDREDGYRSDGHGGKSRGGTGSDDSYDTVNDRPRRRRSRADKYRNGVNEDKPKPSAKQFRNGDPQLNGGFSYHDGPIEPPSNPMSPQAASTASAAATAMPGSTPYPGPFSPMSNPSDGRRTSVQAQNFASQSTSTLRGGMSTGYVPYANIYGQPQQKAFYSPASDASGPYNGMDGQAFQPPMSETGSVQPTFMNQVAPPVAKQPYQQNPFAQDAPLGMQPAYMPNPYYDPRRFDVPYNDPRYEGSTLDDGTETERPDSRSASRRRNHRSDHSPDSQDTRSDVRRTRSERRRDSRTAPSSRGKSTLKGPFDTSARSLGWSGVGALYGGLVGSEVGPGGIPTILGGAALGALGANVFQAREKKKEAAAWNERQQRSQSAKAGARSGYYSD